LAAFALIGLAASVYAPAKYGLATETVPAHWLVRANAWIEVSMVLSVIFGIALGGLLTGLAETSVMLDLWVASQAYLAMAVVIGVYLLAVVLNLGLLPIDQHREIEPLTSKAMRVSSFWKSNQALWRDPLGSVSLYVTTLYWGVGAVMQFAVLVWAQKSLGMTLKSGAYLQALVAIGVILGAFLAGRSFKLHSARQSLPWGLLLAALLPVMVTISDLWLAIPLLLCVGVAGGMLLVPMNALLQYRGMQVLSSGRSIAVQGFNENLCVLVMLAAYSALSAFGVSLTYIMLLLSVMLIAGIAPLCLLLWRQFR
jgi:MFS family permease